MLKGRLPYLIRVFHDKYGSVVRIGPDELVFTDAEAWRDIYSGKEFLRPIQWRTRPPGAIADNLISASIEDHARFRKALGPAFSTKAVELQEPLIASYITLLVRKFHQKIEQSSGNAADVDILRWISLTTFDIMSGLGWGSSFKCLAKQEFHPWITVILQYQARLFGVLFNFYPLVRTLVFRLTPKFAMAGLNLVNAFVAKNVEERLARPTNSPDVMSYIMLDEKEQTPEPTMAMSKAEIIQNSTILIIAGSDPLVTVLTGTFNLLVQHPQELERLTTEIRNKFHAEIEITAASVASLRYLTVVLQEAIRLCPPTPDSMRRSIPKDGATIAGYALPEGTTVGISCYAMFRSKDNFASHDKFLPER